MSPEFSYKSSIIEPYKFCGRGVIYSFTRVFNAPTRFKEQAPYDVAIIELDEGPMMTAQLTDFGNEKPEIGMPVEMVTRKWFSDGDRGVLVYGAKFRPLFTHKS